MRHPRQDGPSGRIGLNWIPLVAALLPAVGVHVSYLIAAAQDHVPWCLVYLEGCTSISSTGRAAPERFIFLSTILPTAVLLMMYWRLNVDWLRQLRGRIEAADRAMLSLGLVAAVALIAYVSVLGLPGSGARLVRRVSVSLFYLMTYAGEVVLTWQLLRLRRDHARSIGPARLSLLSALCAMVLAGVIVSLGLMAFWDGYRDLEDAFEWSLTVLIFLHLLVTGSAWRASGFAARW